MKNASNKDTIDLSLSELGFSEQDVSDIALSLGEGSTERELNLNALVDEDTVLHPFELGELPRRVQPPPRKGTREHSVVAPGMGQSNHDRQVRLRERKEKPGESLVAPDGTRTTAKPDKTGIDIFGEGLIVPSRSKHPRANARTTKDIDDSMMKTLLDIPDTSALRSEMQSAHLAEQAALRYVVRDETQGSKKALALMLLTLLALLIGGALYAFLLMQDHARTTTDLTTQEHESAQTNLKERPRDSIQKRASGHSAGHNLLDSTVNDDSKQVAAEAKPFLAESKPLDDADTTNILSKLDTAQSKIVSIESKSSATIKTLYVRVGSKVKKGERVATIITPLSSKKQRKVRSLEREVRELNAAAKSGHARAKKDLISAKAALSKAKRNRKSITLRATSTGTISKVHVKAGNRIKKGQALVSIEE